MKKSRLVLSILALISVTVSLARALQVEFPNGGETLSPNTGTNITWSLSPFEFHNFYRVKLRTDAEPDWIQIGADVVTPGMWWDVDHVPATGCRIRVEGWDDQWNPWPPPGHWEQVLSSSDESNGQFTIGQSHTVHVTYPNGGELVVPGYAWLVSGSVSGGAFLNFALYASTDGGSSWLFQGIYPPVNFGDYVLPWIVEIPPTASCKVKVRKNLLDGQSFIEDESDATFSVGVPAVVTVVQPNNEQLTIGMGMLVHWSNAGGPPAYYSVDVSRDGGNTYELLGTDIAPNETVFYWTVTGPTSTNVYFRVTAHVLLFENSDTNDSPNTILEPTAPSIRVVTPNGGETWAIGDPVNLGWEVQGANPPEFQIRLSRDNGNSWEVLGSAAQGETSFPWTVSGATAQNALVKVQFQSGATTYEDVSDTPFSIYNENWLTLMSPAGGSHYRVGQQVPINWSIIGTLPNSYVIKLSRDGGSLFNETITPWLPPDATSFVWNASVPVTSQARIRLIARFSQQDSLTDDSGDFTIETATSASEGGQYLPEFVLEQNYPNPFNPVTKIPFEIGSPGHVSLRVTNVLGETVSDLVDGNMSAGHHEVVFDGRDLSSGLYFASLQTKSTIQTVKLLLMK